MASSLKVRTRWAINYVAGTMGLSNRKIGSQMGVKGDTVNSYRSMAADPKAEFIAGFCETYRFDPRWFLTGAGEPFAGAREKVPEVCGEPGGMKAARQTIQDLGEPGSGHRSGDLKDQYIAALEEQNAALKQNNLLLQRALSDRDIHLSGMKAVFDMTGPPPGVQERRAGRIQIEKILALLKNSKKEG